MNESSDQKGNIFVGEGVTITGSFSVPGRAVINGSLNGELSADELLVGKEGRLKGHISVRNADVHGETTETLIVNNHLIVRGTGRVNGKASYVELEIERGGLVAGTVALVEAKTLPSHPASIPVLNVLAESVPQEPFAIVGTEQ